MKKLFYIILIIFVSVFMLACKKDNNDEKNEDFKPALNTNTDCSITVIGNYDNFESLEAEFDKFNEFYPNVRLSYVKVDNYNNNLATVLEGNEKPNIFCSFTWMIDNEKYNSVISHMEDLSKLNLDCIRPGLISHDASGKVFMLPIFSTTYGMLVNEDLFKKVGISIPNTWDDLLSACREFKNNGYDYPMMGYSGQAATSFMESIAFPLFVAELAKNSEALALANNLDPRAGEYMRSSLEAVDQLIKNNCINLDKCDEIKDNYSKVILRFFEGDVPMMICTGDVVSGTKKRESQSEAFTNAPFNYSFTPVPMSNDGAYFIDKTSLEFSVNKDCDNLDMTNEFMRFLISNKVLNDMASIKRLVTPTIDISFDSVYAPFGNIPANRTISPEALGVKDGITAQIRYASFKVGRGELTIDEAIALYGTFK